MPTPPFPRPLITQCARFSAEDRELLAERRHPHTRLGLAYQIAFVRAAGRLPRQSPFEVAPELLRYVADQLGLHTDLVERYAERQPTISSHADLAANHLGYRPFTGDEHVRLEAFLKEEAEHVEQTSALVRRAREHLRQEKILRPAPSTIRRIAHRTRRAFRDRLYERLSALLSDGLKTQLDDLLSVGAEGISDLQLLKEPPGMASPRALKQEATKLRRIEHTGALAIDLSWIRPSLRKALARRARRSDAHRLRELEAPHRYASLACFLHDLRAETIDVLVDMHAKLMTGTYRRAQRRLDDALKEHRRQVMRTLRSFRTITKLVLSDDVPDEDLRGAVLDRISADELKEQLDGAEEWLTGRRSDVFPFVQDRFSYLRQFAPTLLESLELKAEPTGNHDLVEATRLLREMNETGKRKVPSGAPTSFIKKKTRPFVIEEDGRLNRAGYESAVLTAVRDEIRRGNLYVEGSSRYRPAQDFFMPADEWTALRERFFARSGFPADPEAAMDHLRTRLGCAYDGFLKGLPKNGYVTIEDDGQWKFGSDPAKTLSTGDKDELDRLTGWLEQKARRIRLPDLLIEVDNDLRFTRHFFAGGQTERSPAGVCQAVAAVIAYGCNLGPVAMARLTKGVTYEQIRRISDWHLHEDALRGALADITDGIAGLDTAKVWGEGKRSSSDGQRFIFPRKTVKRTYSHRLSDYALEFYSFIADNYAPFYSRPIECSERDAAYVLDGLLYHESELAPEEHYTDTHGYTECNFAAFAMLGRRFCPRIRGLKSQRIYHADSDLDYGPLADMLSRPRRRLRLAWIEAQWDQIARLVGSFAYGHTTASVVMQRLVGFGAKNHLYRAMRELGRLFKTEFILEYLARPDLRRRVRQGLLKSEELHAMARSVFYGKLGRADWRDFRRQMSSASCLVLVLAAIIYWQIREIQRAIAEASEDELQGLRLDLLSRVSPIGWENVQLYGEYVLNPGLVHT